MLGVCQRQKIGPAALNCTALLKKSLGAIQVMLAFKISTLEQFFRLLFLLHISLIVSFTLFLKLLEVTQLFSAAPSRTDNLLEMTTLRDAKPSVQAYSELPRPAVFQGH